MDGRAGGALHGDTSQGAIYFVHFSLVFLLWKIPSRMPFLISMKISQ